MSDHHSLALRLKLALIAVSAVEIKEKIVAKTGEADEAIRDISLVIEILSELSKRDYPAMGGERGQ